MYTQALPRQLDRTRLVLVAIALALAAAAGVAQLGDGASVSGNMPVPGSEVDDTIVDTSTGMPVPGADVEETVVGVSTGMPVPGLDGVVERVVESGN